MSRLTPQPDPAMNFPGFPAAGLQFLHDLAANNDAAWFKPRRDEYEALVRGPMIALVADLLTLAAARQLPINGDPMKAIFRIHRDVRFSRDKQPYKVHCGASLSRTGLRLAPGLFYIHIQPGECFVAAGFWHPEPQDHERLRQRILARPDHFLEIVQALDAKKMPLRPDEEALKRLPRGSEAARGTAVEPFLKHRNLVAATSLTDADVADPTLPHRLIERYQTARPLLEFGWAAVDG
jgi:uncharacterized protein (TIGR02453 family)